MCQSFSQFSGPRDLLGSTRPLITGSGKAGTIMLEKDRLPKSIDCDLQQQMTTQRAMVAMIVAMDIYI